VDMTPYEVRTTQQGQELAMQMPGLMLKTWEKVPSPPSAALIAGIAGATLGALLGKSPLKWGLVSGGGAFVASATVKGSFAAGMMAGGMSMVQACVQDPRGVAATFHEIFPPLAPSSPVVTKGHFAGLPRPLYHAAR